MSAWYMLMDPRFGLYKSGSRSTGRTQWRASDDGRWLVGLRDRLVTKWLRARTMAELRRLDSRLLADIGVRYEDIPATVEQLIPARGVALAAARSRHAKLITVDVDRLPTAA